MMYIYIGHFFFQFKNQERVETVHHNTVTRSCIVYSAPQQHSPNNINNLTFL